MERKNPIELLRKWVRSTSADGLGPLGTNLEEIEEIADEIEAQYMKVPTDRDGKSIRINDRRYGEDGIRWHVIGIMGGSYSVLGKNGQHEKRLKPEWLSCNAPASRENLELELRAVTFERDFWRDEVVRLRELVDSLSKQLGEDDGLAGKASRIHAEMIEQFRKDEGMA